MVSDINLVEEGTTAMNANDQQRENRLKLVEDHIGRALTQSQASGELALAKSFGKPLDFGDGYDETPAELRMGYKILKDAGYMPPEVEFMRDIEALNNEMKALPEGNERMAKQKRLSDMRQQLAIKLERLRPT